MRIFKKIRSLQGKQKREFIAATTLTIALLSALPIYAWFSNHRILETITKIKEPGEIIIRAGKSDATAEDADPIVNFEMKEIDLEKILEDGKAAQYVFSVKPGDYNVKYDLLLAHTTNIPFTYSIYSASAVDTDNMSEEEISELTVYQPGDAVDATYYKKNGDALTLNPLNYDSGTYGRSIAKKNDDYYNNTYDEGDNPEIYAVPVYLKTEVPQKHPENATDSYDYYILEISWDSSADTSNENFEKWNMAVNNKETDMIYITASNNQD